MPPRLRSGGSIELSSLSTLLLAVFHLPVRLIMVFSVPWHYLIEAILRRLWHHFWLWVILAPDRSLPWSSDPILPCHTAGLVAWSFAEGWRRRAFARRRG